MRVRNLLNRRRYKVGLWLLVSLSVVGLALIVLPVLVRYLSLRELRQDLKAPVSIDDIDLNPFTGRARISNLVIGGSASEAPTLKVPSLEIEYSLLELLRLRVQLDSVRLIQPQLRLERTGPAKFNLMDIVSPSTDSPGKSNALANFTLTQLVIRDGKIIIVDHTTSPAFKSVLENVTLRTGTISSLPELRLTPTAFELVVHVDQGTVTLKGDATPIARPIGLEFTAQWENLNPAMFGAYFPDHPLIDFSGRKFSGEARYSQLDGKNPARALTVSFDIGPVAVRSAAGAEPILQSQELRLEDLHWDFLTDQGEVGKIILNRPDILLERPAKGQFTVTQLFSRNEKVKDDHSAPQEAAFPFKVDDLRLEAGSIRLSDHEVNPPVEATLTDLDLSLEDLKLMPGAKPARVDATGRLEDAQVQLKGTLQPVPFEAQLHIDGKKLPLDIWQGYLQTAWRSPLQWRGKLDGGVDLGLASSNDDSLAVDLKGNVEGHELSLAVPGASEAPVQAREMKVTALNIRTKPKFFVDIERIDFLDAYLRVAHGSTGKWNLDPFWQSPPEQTKQSPTKPAASAPFRVGKLTVNQSVIQFIDRRVQPTFRTELSDLAIDMSSLDSQGGRSPLRVQGKLNDGSELDLKGWIKPFSGPLQLSLNGTLRDYDLENLNPYSTRYVRYEIERGRVTTNVEYRYDAGDLNGENQIAIRHLQLGERLGDEFEKRIGVSLKLALALLADSDGRIRLRVPVSGDLRAPRFDLGGLVWKAVRNALVDALAAPLRLLGTVVTLGGKITEVRIHPLTFLPGSLKLSDSGEARLDELAKLLEKKPRLDLEVRGIASRQELSDLKRRQLRERIESAGEPYEEALSWLYRLSQPAASGAKLPSVDAMESFLAQSLALPADALAHLAEDRANFIESALIKRGVAPEKLYVANEKITEDRSGRVEFELLS